MKYRYRRDDELKDSGVEWIGKIPKDWDVKSVKHLVSKNDYYPIGDGDHGSIKPEMYQEEGIPYIRVQNLTWCNNLDFTNMVYISEDVNNQNKKSILRPKDILIAKTGATVGKTAIIPEYIVEANTTSSVGKVTVNHDKINYKYVAYYFQSNSFITQINLTAYQKSAQPGFNIDDLVDYKVSLPDEYNKQEKIANFLDEKTSQFDLIISKKEKLIERLEEAKKSLISEVVTGKVKVIKTDDGYELVKRSSEDMKDSGVEWLGEIPKEWEVSKIKYNCYINKFTLSENTSEDYTLKYIDIGSVDSNGQVSNIQEFLFKNAPSRARRIVNDKDILISTVRTYLKAITSIDNADDNLICSTGFAVLTPTESIDYKFLSYYVRCNLFIDEIVSRSTGVSYPAITSTEIANLEVIIPKNVEQVIIGDYIELRLSHLNHIINKTKSQINKLKEAKQSLISEAVTGKIEILD